jgi:hypothetical protein
MKFTAFALSGILLLGSFASVQAAVPYSTLAGSGQVAVAFLGVPASTDHPTNPNEPYICIWYPLILGDLKLGSLFAPSAAPVVDKEHAYLIWVSDYDAQVVSSTNGGFTLMLVPTGTATIYFNDWPEHRIWTDPTDRSTWGVPVARFVRKAGIFQSADDGYSGTMISSAELVSSIPFSLNGQTFDFRNLIPNGITCYVAGVGDAETGTCVAIGDGM